MTQTLFTPFTVGRLTLPNRIVMAPMTRSMSPGGVPHQGVADYYARRARGGVGLILTEGTTIERGGASNDVNVPNFHTPAALEGWGKVVEAVHAAGGKIAPQLWHVGMVRKPGTGPYPDAPSDGPSGLSGSGKQVAEPMSDADIADAIAAYARAAGRAHRLGFDAVELHGAHGYLIDQFFWERTNQRTDIYGGDLPARTRFAADIVRAVRAVRAEVPADFPVILRFSQWKQQDYTQRLADTPEALAAFLAPLVAAGVDVFHCSTRRFWEPEFEGSPWNLAGWTKHLTGKPVITVGSVGLNSDFIGSFRGENSPVGDLTGLLQRLDAEEFDLVAVGRALISDPDWPAKVRAGQYEALQPFDAEALKTLA